MEEQLIIIVQVEDGAQNDCQDCISSTVADGVGEPVLVALVRTR